jgi:hypothetical protein
MFYVIILTFSTILSSSFLLFHRHFYDHSVLYYFLVTITFYSTFSWLYTFILIFIIITPSVQFSSLIFIGFRFLTFSSYLSLGFRMIWILCRINWLNSWLKSWLGPYSNVWRIFPLLRTLILPRGKKFSCYEPRNMLVKPKDRSNYFIRLFRFLKISYLLWMLKNYTHKFRRLI